MSIELIGAIELLLIAISFFCRPETSLYFMGSLTMLTAAAAVFVGGLPINPAVFFLPVFVIHAFVRTGRGKNMALGTSFGASNVLLLFLAYSLVVTLLAPLFFEGTIQVIWNSRETGRAGLQPLALGLGNFTQGLYAIFAVVCFFSAARLSQSKDGPSIAIRMGLIVAAFNVFYCIMDLATYYTGTADILSVIRNAGYANLTSDTVNGSKRVVGSFPEASFFASFALASFAFLLSLYRNGVQQKWALPLLLLTVAFMIMSASTTAISGLILYGVWLGISALLFFWRRGRIPRRSLPFILMILGAVVFVAVYQTQTKGFDILNAVFVGKDQSESGKFRLALNANAWDNFLSSFGVGVGIGSTRAASFVLVLLSNTGLIGTALYLLFFLKAVQLPKVGTCSDQRRAAISACREGAIAYLIGISLSVATFDFGLMFYVLAGVAVGLSSSVQPAKAAAMWLKPKYYVAAATGKGRYR